MTNTWPETGVSVGVKMPLLFFTFMDYIGSFELIFTVTYSTVLVAMTTRAKHTGKRNSC